MKLDKLILGGILSIALLAGFGCSSTGHAQEPGEDQSIQSGSVQLSSSDSVSESRGNKFKKQPKIGTKAICPVMGNGFIVSDSTQFSEYEGHVYAFCCPGCKPLFDKNPKKYAK